MAILHVAKGRRPPKVSAWSLEVKKNAETPWRVVDTFYYKRLAMIEANRLAKRHGNDAQFRIRVDWFIS